MKEFLTGLILTLPIATTLLAVEIQFEGALPSNAQSIRQRLSSEVNPGFLLLDSLTNELANHGYLDAAITIKDSRILITAGNRYILSKINLIGDSTYSINTSRPFDSANTAFVIEQQLENYRDIGFLYATGQIENVSLEDTLVTLSLRVNKGPQVLYGEPQFTGLTRTDSRLIEKYLPENRDGFLTASYVSEVTRAAREITFVNFKEPVSIKPRPGYRVSDLVLDFIEKTPVHFDGAAGISGSDNADLVWSFNLKLNNLFGQGKQANLRSERPDSRRSQLSVGYEQPLFLIGLGELNLNVATRDYRDEFYEFAVGAGYSTRIDGRFIAGMSLAWKSVKPETGYSGYNRYSGHFSISRKTFRSDFNPKSGLLLKWGIDFSHRKYTAANLPADIQARTFNEYMNSLDSRIYQPLIGQLQFFWKLAYIGLETSEDLPPLSELILIGGPGTIRGYRNEQFRAIRAAFGTLEPRLRFNQGFISIFYDAAYINNRVLDSDRKVITDERFKWSYGVGFGLGNSRRNLLLSLGVNPDLGIGDPRLSIKLSSDL